MNAIAQTESFLVASATRTEHSFAPSDAAPIAGGFPDAAAAQRHTDRATAARLTYEARIARERKERDRLTQVATLAREEGRVEALVQLAAERHAGFLSSLPPGPRLRLPHRWRVLQRRRLDRRALEWDRMTPAAPAANWIQVPPQRGCMLCRYGAFDAAGERTCTCPDARRPGPTPVVLVRDARGACGPDARFLDFPGLQS